MLAYSTVAHVGFIFLGLLAGTQAGFYAKWWILQALLDQGHLWLANGDVRQWPLIT